LHRYRRLGAERDGFDAFREMLALPGLSKISQYAPLAAYYLQEAFPGHFEELKALFTGIFTSVEELKVLAASEPSTSSIRHELAIRERGSNGWIGQAEMSSGMLRTLVHLIELTLAPRGSVIIIDEFENSLGVNCMPQLTDFILGREQDLQFIITSHHPYVINNVPPATWKLVTRKGGSVRIIAARDIPSLQKISHQQAFIRLINLPEFEEGIS
jgi:predicted ATPase